MKVLFVCRANVVRSQMAAALLNAYTKSNIADSAGTMVDKPGETLGRRSQSHPASKLVLETMATRGLDLSESSRTQLTAEMLPNYDIIINMAGPQYTPSWLSNAPQYQFWDVADPMAKGLHLTKDTADILEQKIELLATTN